MQCLQQTQLPVQAHCCQGVQTSVAGRCLDLKLGAKFVQALGQVGTAGGAGPRGSGISSQRRREKSPPQTLGPGRRRALGVHHQDLLTCDLMQSCNFDLLFVAITSLQLCIACICSVTAIVCEA